MRIPAKEFIKVREGIKKAHFGEGKFLLCKAGMQADKHRLFFLRQTEPMTIEELRKEFEIFSGYSYFKKHYDGSYHDRDCELDWQLTLKFARHLGMVKE